jgi:D-glycero-D-manno-heptose 1,7-bisphosphate phosphatase
MEKAIFLNRNYTDFESLKLLSDSGFKLIKLAKPHLVQQVVNEHDLDLKKSWMVGELLEEIEAGNKIGCRTILLASGVETTWNITHQRQPEFISPNFQSATGAIILKTIYEMLKTN